MPLDSKTIVTNAAGEAREFGDWLSKTIVAHPKAAALAALVVGVVAGHVLK